MYDIVSCPCTKFETNRSSHVQVLALDMQKLKQNGRLAAILDRITKQIDVHMYDLVSCPCIKFETNQSRHVQVVALDM